MAISLYDCKDTRVYMEHRVIHGTKWNGGISLVRTSDSAREQRQASI